MTPAFVIANGDGVEPFHAAWRRSRSSPPCGPVRTHDAADPRSDAA